MGHVLLDLGQRLFCEAHIVRLAELRQALWLSCESRLNLEDVEKSLSSDLTCVWSKEDVLARLNFDLISKSDGFFELKVFK